MMYDCQEGYKNQRPSSNGKDLLSVSIGKSRENRVHLARSPDDNAEINFRRMNYWEMVVNAVEYANAVICRDNNGQLRVDNMNLIRARRYKDLLGIYKKDRKKLVFEENGDGNGLKTVYLILDGKRISDKKGLEKVMGRA